MARLLCSVCVGGCQWPWGVPDKALHWHLQPGPTLAFVRGEETGKTRPMEQPQSPSGKRQGERKLGKQKQDREGLEHLQPCSDMPAPQGCRRHNNGTLCGVEVPARDVHLQVGKD